MKGLTFTPEMARAVMRDVSLSRSSDMEPATRTRIIVRPTASASGCACSRLGRWTGRLIVTGQNNSLKSSLRFGTLELGKRL